MAWFADLAGKAESLLNNLDEQTGAALRNHNVTKTKKLDKHEVTHPDIPPWGPKKRPIPRNLKKSQPINETRSNYSPVKKQSPTSHPPPHSQVKESHEHLNNQSVKQKRYPARKLSPVYNLNNCPKTLVGDIDDTDIIMDQFGLKQRRCSLPADLEIMNRESLTYRMQNLEVENAMLKNELNVMNREVSELLDRLRKTEDELSTTHTKLENSELLNHSVNLDKESLIAQLEHLKNRVHELTVVEINQYKEKNHNLETEIALLTDKNKELDEKVKELTAKTNEQHTVHIKLENELRHTQSVIGDLQSDLEKSNAECHRLEKDWETYKLRVKSMLYAKDNEIKALQDGMNLTEDTKILIEQLESLKEEREELSEAITRVRGEYGDTKKYIEQLESRNTATERVVAALRDALKEERSARNRAEAQCNALGKELKSVEIEAGQTIASLRADLREKENELNHLRETTSSSLRSTDTSALNVADYDTAQGSIESEKIQYLTEMLVQRQGRVDTLLADNNMLRIQLGKLESKYKSELAALRANHNHSVVHLPEGDYRRTRTKHVDSTLSTFSMRLGVFIRRYPIFRVFIILYMIGLHLWVITVLFTSTPENYLTRPTKT